MNLLNSVETAWPNDMWELRAQLLQGSPHLSKEVLKKAADLTDVLPESIIFEVLRTNPDELKDNKPNLKTDFVPQHKPFRVNGQ